VHRIGEQQGLRPNVIKLRDSKLFMNNFAASNAQPPKSPGGGLSNNIVKFIHINVIFSKQMSFKSPLQWI
jgi:hypothetical protein